MLNIGKVVERIAAHDIDIDDPNTDPGRQGETGAEIGHVPRTTVSTAEIDDEKVNGEQKPRPRTKAHLPNRRRISNGSGWSSLVFNGVCERRRACRRPEREAFPTFPRKNRPRSGEDRHAVLLGHRARSTMAIHSATLRRLAELGTIRRNKVWRIVGNNAVQACLFLGPREMRQQSSLGVVTLQTRQAITIGIQVMIGSEAMTVRVGRMGDQRRKRRRTIRAPTNEFKLRILRNNEIDFTMDTGHSMQVAHARDAGFKVKAKSGERERRCGSSPDSGNKFLPPSHITSNERKRVSQRDARVRKTETCAAAIEDKLQV
jgi:hypothetical protein